jgi:hypothetical protein
MNLAVNGASSVRHPIAVMRSDRRRRGGERRKRWSAASRKRRRRGLAPDIAKLGGHLPQPQRLDRRVSPQLLAEPLPKRIELRDDLRPRVPRGEPNAAARATVSRAIPSDFATCRCERRSTHTNRRISAHCSTPATHSSSSPNPHESDERQRPAGQPLDPAPSGLVSTGVGGPVFNRRPQEEIERLAAPLQRCKMMGRSASASGGHPFSGSKARPASAMTKCQRSNYA